MDKHVLRQSARPLSLQEQQDAVARLRKALLTDKRVVQTPSDALPPPASEGAVTALVFPRTTGSTDV